MIVASLFERRAPGIYHNTAAIIDADGTLSREVPQDAHPGRPALSTRSFTSLRAISGFRRGTRSSPASASASAGTNGIPRRRGSRRCAARRFSSTPPPSAGIRRKRPTMASRQHSSWETVQRGHAVANGCYVAVPNRVGHEAPDGGDGIEFWGQSFICDPSGTDRRKGLRRTRRSVIVAEVGPGCRRNPAHALAVPAGPAD